MTIEIDTRRVYRGAVATVALAGIGAGAFFGGQSTRMSNTARAAQRNAAITVAVNRTKRQDAATLHTRLVAEAKAAKRHEEKALSKLHKKDVKNANKLASEARSQGYSAGNSAGYSNGQADGYGQGTSDGYNSGYFDGSFDTCVYDGTC